MPGGRDPKRAIFSLIGLYAIFQLTTQTTNSASFSRSNLIPPSTGNGDDSSPWRPQR